MSENEVLQLICVCVCFVSKQNEEFGVDQNNHEHHIDSFEQLLSFPETENECNKEHKSDINPLINFDEYENQTFLYHSYQCVCAQMLTLSFTTHSHTLFVCVFCGQVLS
jgi:hypothetical protein